MATDQTQREPEDMSYNARVKHRLIVWRDAFEKANCDAKLNYSAIAERMERDFGISTSPQKISAMFDRQSSREVKLQELAALCQIFNIPMQDICAYPGAPGSDMDVSALISRKNGKHDAVRHLSNLFYQGRYYCYYFRKKHYQDKLKPVEESDLSEAVMDIRIENGSTTVTLTENKVTTNFFGNQVAHAFTLTGKLYHFENTDMAYSFLTDTTGRRAMALMFSFLNLSADIRYYMTMGMMTFALNQTHVPLFQKMAVFKVRQDVYNDPAQADLVRGILALNTCPIILDEETMLRLMEEDEDIRKLIGPEKALKKCYSFSETAIRSASYFIRDDDEKMRLLLKLRKNSLYPAHEIIAEPDYFADFIKHYQQQQLRERPECFQDLMEQYW